MNMNTVMKRGSAARGASPATAWGGRALKALAGLALLATHAVAASTLGLRPGSRLWLEGNSTLHAFKSTATVMTVSLAADEGGTERSWEALVRAGRVRSFDLTIPVRGMKSGKAGLDKNLYETLGAAKYPDILFHLARYEVEKSTASGTGLTVRAFGALAVAGVARDVEIDGEVEPGAGGMVIHGRKELLMTDFGVKPPTMMLGVVKTDNRVVIRFDLVLGADERRLP